MLWISAVFPPCHLKLARCDMLFPGQKSPDIGMENCINVQHPPDVCLLPFRNWDTYSEGFHWGCPLVQQHFKRKNNAAPCELLMSYVCTSMALSLMRSQSGSGFNPRG